VVGRPTQLVEDAVESLRTVHGCPIAHPSGGPDGLRTEGVRAADGDRSETERGSRPDQRADVPRIGDVVEDDEGAGGRQSVGGMWCPDHCNDTRRGRRARETGHHPFIDLRDPDSRRRRRRRGRSQVGVLRRVEEVGDDACPERLDADTTSLSEVPTLTPPHTRVV
jgi:hypothetical protein